MLPHNHHSHPQGEDERRREEIWRDATGEVMEIANHRYSQLARLLGLGPPATRAFVTAAMEATRQYQTGYMYANYERRTGHPFPDEGRENEVKVWAAAWAGELTRLESALAQERK